MERKHCELMGCWALVIGSARACMKSYPKGGIYSTMHNRPDFYVLAAVKSKNSHVHFGVDMTGSSSTFS